jgi:hypothetical protein
VPSLHERAEAAGRFLAERERALVDDPDIQALRRSGSLIEAAGFEQPSWPEPEPPARDDRAARAVWRMSSSAASDDGYRVQLLDLAALHGGLFLEAVNALYAIEARSLGRSEAFVRCVLDQRQILQTRARERGEELTLVGVTGDDA